MAGVQNPPSSGGVAVPVPIADGGTAATTAAGARTNLGLGTMAVQNANNVAITGGTITGVTGLGEVDVFPQPASLRNAPPVAASGLWTNANTLNLADVTQPTAGIYFSGLGNATDLWRRATLAFTTEVTFTGRIRWVTTAQGYQAVAMILRESATGKLLALLIGGNNAAIGSTVLSIAVNRFTNDTTFAAAVAASNACVTVGFPVGMKAVIGGGNVTCTFTLDGYLYTALAVVATTTAFTTAPDGYGLGYNAASVTNTGLTYGGICDSLQKA